MIKRLISDKQREISKRKKDWTEEKITQLIIKIIQELKTSEFFKS